MGKHAQKSILFVQFPWRMSLVRLAGVYRYASEMGWRVQVAEYGRSTESIPKMLAFWNPDGCIVEGGCLEEKGFDISAFNKVPTVFCDSSHSGRKGGLPGVMQDSSDAAVLAARELLSLGLDDYAFVGYVKHRTWSDQRREMFCRIMGEKGKTCHVFDPRSNSTVDGIISRLGTFLAALPKPCGIFAANDLVADLVLHCCRQNGFAVPESIAVVGVDNDKLICENSTPTLTSVAPGSRSARRYRRHASRAQRSFSATGRCRSTRYSSSAATPRTARCARRFTGRRACPCANGATARFPDSCANGAVIFAQKSSGVIRFMI